MLFLAIYGKDVSIFDSLFISIFSMIIVFLVLLIISYMIDIVAKVIGSKKKNVTVVDNDNIDNNIIDNKSDSELVAIIAASIDCMLNKNVDDIVIKRIKRVNSDFTSWSNKGLIDNLN